MAHAEVGENLFCRDAASRVGLHRIVDRHNFRTQPILDCGITLLQRTQSRPYHFARGGVGSPPDLRIDKLGLFGWQAERAFAYKSHQDSSIPFGMIDSYRIY